MPLPDIAKVGARGASSAGVKRVPLWLCAVLNQAAFPGMGTVLAGRRIGYAQAALMVAGFLMVLVYFGWFMACTVRYLQGSIGSEEAWRAHYRELAWAWQRGLALCAVAWIWSMFSTVGFLRARKRSEP